MTDPIVNHAVARGELRPPLVRSRQLRAIPVDDVKLDEAVRCINEKTIRGGLDLARDVGRYILDAFFDGDYANFADPSSRKETSFRALLERQDLLLGGATVYSFVRITHQLEHLPPELAGGLTLSQHRALLPLSDPEVKEILARRAVDEEWSVRDLTTEVRRRLPRSRRGRKPLPGFAKAIAKVAGAADPALVEELTPDTVRLLGRDRATVLAAQLEEGMARLEALRKALEDARHELWPRRNPTP